MAEYLCNATVGLFNVSLPADPLDDLFVIGYANLLLLNLSVSVEPTKALTMQASIISLYQTKDSVTRVTISEKIFSN